MSGLERLLRVVPFMPAWLRRLSARLFGAVLYRLAGKRRRVAQRNLEACFPDWSAAERARCVRQHFTEFAASVLDRGILWFGTERQVRDLVAIEGLEHLPLQGPVLLLAPHFVGLDAGWTRLTLERPLASMYQPQADPAADELMRRGRSRFNDAQLVGKHEGIRPLLRWLRERPIYYLPDMDFGGRDSVFVPFFGVQAATLLAPARIAGGHGAQVVPAITRRDPRTGRYCVRLEPAWHNYPGPDLTEATRRLNQALEQWVVQMPAQYLWVHQRFKTRPEGQPPFYA